MAARRELMRAAGGTCNAPQSQAPMWRYCARQSDAALGSAAAGVLLTCEAERAAPEVQSCAASARQCHAAAPMHCKRRAARWGVDEVLLLGRRRQRCPGALRTLRHRSRRHRGA